MDDSRHYRLTGRVVVGDRELHRGEPLEELQAAIDEALAHWQARALNAEQSLTAVRRGLPQYATEIAAAEMQAEWQETMGARLAQAQLTIDHWRDRALRAEAAIPSVSALAFQRHSAQPEHD